MGYDDTRDRELFEESAMSQQPTVPDRLRWLLQTFKYQKNIRIHAFNEEGMEPYPHGWDAVSYTHLHRNSTRWVAGIWRKMHSSTARLNHGS